MTATNPTTVRKVIDTPTLVAIFDVPVIYVVEMPDEPMLEAQTLKFLDEARRRAAADDRVWLRANGARLFVRLEDVSPDSATSSRVA